MQIFSPQMTRAATTLKSLIQGISYWNVTSKSALRGGRIHNSIELWCLVGSRGLDIWVLSISFQKSNKGWPQQDTDSKGSVRIKKKSNYNTETLANSDFWTKYQSFEFDAKFFGSKLKFRAKLLWIHDPKCGSLTKCI